MRKKEEIECWDIEDMLQYAIQRLVLCQDLVQVKMRFSSS